MIGLSAKHWLLREDLEAFMQAVQVAPGLYRSEVHDRIFMDAIEIGGCFPRQPIGGHRPEVGSRLPP